MMILYLLVIMHTCYNIQASSALHFQPKTKLENVVRSVIEGHDIKLRHILMASDDWHTWDYTHVAHNNDTVQYNILHILANSSGKHKQKFMNIAHHCAEQHPELLTPSATLAIVYHCFYQWHIANTNPCIAFPYISEHEFNRLYPIISPNPNNDDYVSFRKKFMFVQTPPPSYDQTVQRYNLYRQQHTQLPPHEQTLKSYKIQK